MIALRQTSVSLLAISLIAAQIPSAQARSPEPAEAAEAAEAAPGPDGADAEPGEAAQAEAAATEPATPDQVVLRDGGMVKGTIVEVLQSTSVTIITPGAETPRVFAWPQIARYTQDGAWVMVEGGTDEAPRRERSGYGPNMHIETTRPGRVKLFEITSETVAAGGNVVVHAINYRAVCSAPCDDTIDVSAGRPFFFGGEGLTPSRRFDLSSSGRVSATVRPGRKWVWTTGLVLFGLSPSAIVGGAIWHSSRKRAAADPGIDALGNPLPPTEADIRAPVALITLGVAMLIGGVTMMILGRTRYKLR